MHYLFRLIVLLIFSLPLLSWAADCLDVFPDVSTNYGDQLILPSYKFSSGVDGDIAGGNLAVAAGNYDDIYVSKNGSVFFTQSDAEYRIDSLFMEKGSTAQFVAGDYWINDLHFEKDSTLAVVGAGTVRIFVQNATFAKNARINDAGGYLIFVSYDDISADKDFRFTGAMYAVDDISVDKSAVILGAVTGDSVDLGNSFSETYDPDFINNADFDGMCGAGGSNPAVLELHYNFNEGAGQTASDSSGNGRHGTLGNSAGIDGNDPTWTCEASGYTLDFDDTRYHFVQTPAFSPPTIGAASFWVKVPQLPATQQRIFGFSNGWEVRWLNDGTLIWDGNLAGQNTNMRGVNLLTEIDTWVHLVFVTNVNSGNWAIYKNGVLENSGTESLTAETSTVLSIGASTWALGSQHFKGELDDFRIYSGELTQDEITALAANPPGNCPLNHYQIIHDGSGLTCDAESVTIKACSNSFDGTCTLSAEHVTLDFIASGAGDTVTKSVAFTGSTNVSFNYIHAENVTLSIANDNPDANAGYVCNDNNAGSCNIAFADTGFVFSNISTQTSNKPSSNITITAVETNAQTGQCQGKLIGNNTIQLGAVCENPLQCNGHQVNINNGSDNPIATVNNAAAVSYTNVSLDFGDSQSSSATFTLNYPDAGQMQLNARYNLPDPDTGEPSNEYMRGTSNSFVVKPYGLFIDVPNNTATKEDFEEDPAGVVTFKKAGEDFAATITAVAWTQDNDDDLSDNPITPNFGNEIAGETLNLTHQLVTPDPTTYSDAEVGILSGDAASAISMTNGSSGDLTLRWNEVGIIELNAELSDKDYFGEGNLTGQVEYVGRFYPDSLWQSIESGDEGSIVAQHKELGTCEQNWAYSGQYTLNVDGTVTTDGAIKYDLLPIYTITPYGVNSGPNDPSPYKIKNYVYAGLNKISTYEIIVPTTDDQQLQKGSLTQKVAVTATMTSSSLELETDEDFLTYTFNQNDHFVYQHSALSYLNEFDANIRLAVNLDTFDEADLVPLYKLNDEDIVLDNLKIRTGRLRIESNYGPDTSDLTAPLVLEYLNAVGNFVVNTDDSCFVPKLGNRVDTGNLHSGGLALGDYRLVPDNTDSMNKLTRTSTQIQSVSEQPFTTGKFDKFVFDKTNATFTDNANTGNLTWELEVPEWLKFDWELSDSDEAPTQNPTAELQFGTYRGNDRIISWREIHPN
ncbi:DUF6701 domain-containing protein [Thalassotalea fusca]